MPHFATSKAIGVLIADCNRMQAQLLATALRRRPEMQIACCSLELATLLESVSAQLPRVALLSLNSSSNDSEAMTTLQRLHLAHPGIAKVLLVDECKRELVIEAFRSGARGIFSLADANLRLLSKCILSVASGQVWANTEQLNYILGLISETPSLRVVSSSGGRLLTPREEQVVALVAEGLGNRQIAAELNLSQNTVKKYIFRIFEKLGVSNRVELVLYAVHNGDPRQAEWLFGSSRMVPRF